MPYPNSSGKRYARYTYPRTSFAITPVTLVPKYSGTGISSALQGNCFPMAVVERLKRAVRSSIGEGIMLGHSTLGLCFFSDKQYFEVPLNGKIARKVRIVGDDGLATAEVW